jgi:hypothetical protein
MLNLFSKKQQIFVILYFVSDFDGNKTLCEAKFFTRSEATKFLAKAKSNPVFINPTLIPRMERI